jgi:SAM-dependent methyltransferase
MEINPRYQDYVIKDGKLIGDFEGLYKKFDDPWNQSSVDQIFDSRKQLALLACLRLRDQHNASRVIELGCGFGFLTDQLKERGFNSVGTDISSTSIQAAKQKNPNSRFEVAAYNDFDFLRNFNPDIVLMAELTWYTLDTLDEFLSGLEDYARQRLRPTFLIHLLTTYEPGIQKYGADKFTNLQEILKYFNMQYLEYGFIKTAKEADQESQGTYFVAKI